MSSAEDDLGRGRRQAESGKLREAKRPLGARAATSWALAAISGVGKVPSHILDFLRGSRTSHTHLFPFLCRTPLYIGCRVSRNFFLPAFRLCPMHCRGSKESEELGFVREEEDDDEAENSSWSESMERKSIRVEVRVRCWMGDKKVFKGRKHRILSAKWTRMPS